jgi:hypothetical protein
MCQYGGQYHRHVSGPDLEIVAVTGEGASRAPPGRHLGRWPWAVGGAVAMVAVLVFPVRTSLAHAEVDRLERAWSQLVALDSSRSSLVNRLVSESVPTDGAALREATIALDDEEATNVIALRRSLPANRSLDHGAGALRRAMVHAFDQEVAGLRAAVTSLKRGNTVLPSQLDATTVDFEAVQNQIDGQRRRFGEDLHDQRPATATLHAADATLATFSHFTNVSVGVRLLVTTNFGVRVLDVDRSTDTAVDLGSDTQLTIAYGSVYAVSQRRVFRLAAGLSGDGQDLGPGDRVFPAPHGSLWIATSNNTLRLVTPEGHTEWGPHPFPLGFAGSVNAGMVLPAPPSPFVAIVDPLTGTIIRRLDLGPVSPLLLGMAGDTVAYTHNHDADIHVVSVSSGAVRDIPILPSGSLQTGVAALSPDGHWLATYRAADGGSATPIIVDLRTGAVTRLTDVTNPDPQLSMAWTTDSSRLFFTVNEDGATVATWHIGDSSATVLRWRSATASTLAVLP